MLAQLSRGDSNVSDLARPFLNDMTLPAITKHIKVLERAGLITKTRDAQWRSCKLNGDGLKDVADWVEEYRVFWEESFDRLEAYLKTVTSKESDKQSMSDSIGESGAETKVEAQDASNASAKDKKKGTKRGRKKQI